MADEHASPGEKEGKLNQLPLSKIKTIMKSSPDLVNVSQDSVFLITKATELFVHHLTEAALKEEEKKKLLTYKALSKLVDNEDNLQFLADIVPPKVLFKDYLASVKKSDTDTIEIDTGISNSDSE